MFVCRHGKKKGSSRRSRNARKSARCEEGKAISCSASAEENVKVGSTQQNRKARRRRLNSLRRFLWRRGFMLYSGIVRDSRVLLLRMLPEMDSPQTTSPQLVLVFDRRPDSIERRAPLSEEAISIGYSALQNELFPEAEGAILSEATPRGGS